MSKPVVFILGATGLFGGLLAQRLIRQGRFDVVCAGRNQGTLEAFCNEHGGRSYRLDRQNDVAVQQALETLKPFAVVDCAGPYQAYGDQPYKFATAALNAGAHYIDIADASDFVKGFSQLDALAKTKNVVALSGASSTPAISSSIADRLVESFTEVEQLTTVIIPGNRAKRTISVMRSILSQVGQPMQLTRFGKQETVYGWGETEAFDLNVSGKNKIRGRLASFVDTPDIAFFADRYNAKTVLFKAGLEVKLFHYALSLGRILVGSGLLKSLEPTAGFLRWLASWFVWMGSDEGGMKVSALGRTSAGHYERREWDLIADDGHGPNIPTLPVSIMLNNILDGGVEAGARACLGEVTVDELAEALAEFGGKSETHVKRVSPIFQAALRDEFEKLPQAVRDFHGSFGKHVYEGKADIKGPTGVLGKLAAWLVGFPGEAKSTPVKVSVTSDDTRETWVREFGDKSFQSNLSLDGEGYIEERFGMFHIRIGVREEDGKMHYPVLRGRLFGKVPFPKFLLPISISHESEDEQGRFKFDILAKFPFGGRIAHYQGWLVRCDP